MAQKVTSTDIKLALKEFHNGKPSYFITECKTCSTYFPDPQGLLKFDGLAITKSYTKPNIRRYMEECLFENEYITGVQDLEVSQIKDVLHIKFTLVTDVGSKEVEMDV